MEAMRYSKVATEKRRRKNFDRWLEKSKEKWGATFDYRPSLTTYTAQKSPVEIICKQHGQFTTTPAQHTMQMGGGCPVCGPILRGKAKTAYHLDGMLSWIDSELPEHLELLDELTSGGAKIRVRCKIHGTIKTTTYHYLRGNKILGCDACARDGMIQGQKHSTSKLKQLYEHALPEHLHIIRRSDEGFKAEMFCDLHGEFSVGITTLRVGSHICPTCKLRSVGYANDRLSKLIKQKSRGKLTWLGVMHVNVFGIDCLKVGVTTRTLEARYAYNLRKVFFAVQLDEVTAYTFENAILERFHNTRDERVLKKGMRDGERWGGDTELFRRSQRQEILDFLNELLEEPKADYGSAQSACEEMLTRINVKTNREKDLTNRPKAVVGLDLKSLEKIKRFPSMSKAAGAGFHNLSEVLCGNRPNPVVGGLLWVSEEEFYSEDLASILRDKQEAIKRSEVKAKAQGKPVYCLEADTHFHSTREAANELTAKGVSINASHITSVCRGKRPRAGGYRWCYSDLSHEQIFELRHRKK